MRMNSVTGDSYLNINLLDTQFAEAMKAQERVAIQAIISAQTNKIRGEATSFVSSLDSKAENMKDYASKSLTGRLKEGLEGKSSDAANDYLEKTLKKPSLKNPIKGG